MSVLYFVVVGPLSHIKPFVSRSGEGSDGILYGDLEDGESLGPAYYYPHKGFIDLTHPSWFISVFPDAIIGISWAVVNVTWTGAFNIKTQQGDWFGVYCPESAAHDDYVDWFWANHSKNVSINDRDSDQHPNQFVLYRVHNARTATCQLRYFADTHIAYEHMATSNAITFAQNIAYHGRLALTGRPAEMSVQWVSAVGCMGPAGTPSVVRWGRHDGALDHMTTSVACVTYIKEDMCSAPANTSFFVSPGYQHAVTITNLLPGERYDYTFGQDGGIFSPVYNFVQPYATGNVSAPPLRFVVYGDMGIYDGVDGDCVRTRNLTLTEVQRTDGNASSLVVHCGDLSYAMGGAYVWDKWLWLIEPVATRVPYMLGVGNHEYDHTVDSVNDPTNVTGNGYHPTWGNFEDDSMGECGVPATKRFRMPNSNTNSLPPFWFSYDVQLTHFVHVSTEHDCEPNSRQYAWLQSDLQAVNRKITPWIIIIGHRAMYNSEAYMDNYNVSLGLRRAFEYLLLRYNVNLALWGHYHAYQRTCPVSRNECTSYRSGGVVHITIGSAGADVDNDVLYPTPWSAFFKNTYGYGRICVVNSTHMYWEFVENRDNIDGKSHVIDDVWIINVHK